VIHHPGLVIVGRYEEPVETAERQLVRMVAEQAFAAYLALQRGPRAQIRETVDAIIGRSSMDLVQTEDVFWGAWNAVACVGHFGRWSHLDFLEVAHLGVCQAPWALRRWRFIPAQDQTDRLPLGDGLSAPVIYGSSKLVSDAYVAKVATPVSNMLGTTAMDRLVVCEKELMKLGLELHPMAQTRYGLREVLAQMGFRLRDPDKIWTHSDPKAPLGLDLLGPEELQVRMDEPRLPHSSTTGRPWTTLDDALARGMGKVDPRAP
jgi:hypothetical protein